MRRKNQKLKTVRHFIIDGKEYLESEISEETKEKIYQELGQRAMEAVKTAESSGSALASLKKSLDDYNTFYQGLVDYTEGVWIRLIPEARR